MRARNLALALELIDGRWAAAACREVGYAATTAAKKGYRIVGRSAVPPAIVEFGYLVSDDCKCHNRARLLVGDYYSGQDRANHGTLVVTKVTPT